MADMMQFDLVSPERRLASVEASEIVIPAADGEMTAKPGHAPFVSTLRPGVIRVVTGKETLAYVVTGGLLEVSPTAVSVLAEDATLQAEFNRDTLAARLATAEAALAQAGDEASKMAARARIDGVRQLGVYLGV